MNRKGLFLIPVLLIGIIGAGLWKIRPAREIRMAVPWQDEQTLDTLREIAGEFEQTTPKLKIRLTGMELGELNDIWKSGHPEDIFDIGVASSSSYTGKLPDEDRFVWTGVIWSLYYNKEVLRSVGWQSGPPQQFLDGSAGMDELEALFGNLLKEGYVPFSAGGRYTWPLAALIQHLILYEDRRIDLNSWDKENPVPESFETGWDRYEKWKKQEWLSPDHLRQDWPASILKVTSGEAAFVLIPSTLATTIPPEETDNTGLIPFPSGSGEPWTVGSLWELAVPDGAAQSRQALRFARYLTEEQTVSELQDSLNRRFFSRDNRTDGELHASVTGDLHSPFMEWAKDRLR